MKHLDEGTIHAWLDGALHPAQAGEVDAHVRECSRCAETVAEARGLIAASSRVLRALDDVPANVLPAMPARKSRRVWRAAPWVTGIAALLLAAVLLRMPQRARTESAVAGPARMATDTAVPLAAAGDMRSRESAAPEVSAQRTRVAQAPSGRGAAASAPRKEVGGRAGAGVTVTGATAAEGATAAVPANPQVLAAEDARVARRQGAADESRARTRADASAELDARQEKAQVAAAPSPPPAAMAPQSTPLIDMRTVRPIDPLRDTAAPYVGLAGCYLVTPVPRERTFASGLSSAARERGAARGSVPSAAAAVAEDRAPDRLLVRLDTVGGGPGYVVRAARGDSTVGWWRRITPDSAQLDLRSAGVVSVRATQRIPCPESPD